METRLVHKHSEECEKNYPSNVSKWYFLRKVEYHNRKGWGDGFEEWLVFGCPIGHACPAKMLVSQSSIAKDIELKIEGMVA